MTLEANAARVEDTIEVSAAGAALVVRVVGELDAASRRTIEPALLGAIASAPRVVFDLGGVTFCDSTGISTFVAAHQKAEAERKSLALRNVPASLRRLFDITGVDRTLHLLE